MSRRFLSLLFFLGLVFFIEGLGHFFTFQSVTSWYLTLNKPSWTPPSWVFGPVWTILYICIAVSGWLIFTRRDHLKNYRFGFAIYGAQLFCNLIWSYFFFYLQSPGLALLDIVVLVLLIFINMVQFLKMYRPAGLLLVPYFIWTVYAVFLNASIWILN